MIDDRKLEMPDWNICRLFEAVHTCKQLLVLDVRYHYSWDEDFLTTTTKPWLRKELPASLRVFRTDLVLEFGTAEAKQLTNLECLEFSVKTRPQDPDTFVKASFISHANATSYNMYKYMYGMMRLRCKCNYRIILRPANCAKGKHITWWPIRDPEVTLGAWILIENIARGYGLWQRSLVHVQ